MTSDAAHPLEELFAASEARWRRHVGALDPYPQYELHGPGSTWTQRDEYAHHGRWFAQSLMALLAHLGEIERPSSLDQPFEALNEVWQSEDRALSREQARARALEARGALMQALREVPPERVDGTVREIAESDPVDHLDAHFQWIIEGLLQEEAHQWARLSAALEAHRGGAFQLEGEPWDARDVWSHTGRWLTHAVDFCEAQLAGEPLPRIEDPDPVNAQWHAEDRSLSLEEARARASAARGRALAFMGGLDLEQWGEGIYGVMGANTAYHYREHLQFAGLEEGAEPR